MSRKNSAELKLDDQTNILPFKQLIVVYASLSISCFICFADQNGIGVALPTIARDLNAHDTISWAGTSSLIANTVFQVLYGRMSDIFGRKIVYLSAVALLVVADILCSVAPNAYALYVFRGLAGIANGGISSLTMMIVSDVVTLKQRGKYQGIIGACIGLGNTFGPLVSGAFAQNSTWRGFFWLLAPLGFCTLISGIFFIPNKPVSGSPMEKIKLIDWWGLGFGTVAIMLLLIPISGGGAYFQWSSPMVIAMLTIGSVALVGFVLVEAFVSKLPMTPPSMFKIVPVATMLTQNFLFGMAYYAELYYLPLYFENVRGWDPLKSAALLIPLVITQATVSCLSGLYISHFGRYGEVIYSGFFMWTLGSGLMLLFNRDTPIVAIVFIVITIGFGVGNVFQPSLIGLQAHAPKSQRAVIISNRNFLRSLGGAFGLAISAAILQMSLKTALPENLRYIANNAYARPDLSKFNDADREAILDAYMAAIRTVFIWFVPLIGICFLGCLLVQDRGLEQKESGPMAETKSRTNSQLDAESQSDADSKSRFESEFDPESKRNSTDEKV